MTRLVISIFLLLITSCKTDTRTWKTLDYGSFKLNTPYGWKKFKETGIDSYVGGLTNGEDSIWFDYGWFSAEIDDVQTANHLYGQDTINGLIATIQIPKVDGQGCIRLSIPHVNEKDRFSLSGNNIKGTNTVLKIFKSLVFEESDTTRNSHLTLDKFKEYPFGSGQTLFSFQCAGCHSVTRFLTGPPLLEVLQQRSNDWVYKFLKDRKAVPIDSLRKERIREANEMQCNRFPDLTKNDIDQILNYARR